MVIMDSGLFPFSILNLLESFQWYNLEILIFFEIHVNFCFIVDNTQTVRHFCFLCVALCLNNQFISNLMTQDSSPS